MAKATDLVIVESPSKASTIKGYLGSNYKVIASKGHVRDLPKSSLGVDIENGFEPIYGARPLRRFIQSKVETLVGRLIIAEAPAEKSVIIVDLKDGALHASVK